MMNVEQRQAADNPQTKSTNFGDMTMSSEPTSKLLLSTLIIDIYYYSTRKQISLILPSHGG